MTKVRVVDIETSGLPEEEQHAICEIGWYDLHLETMAINNPISLLANPGHPLRPHVRAVHHISDEMVANAMTPDKAVQTLLLGIEPGDVLAAHFASFEQKFIDAGDIPWICTWKVSLRAWPEFVSHGNQALRYELDIDAEADFNPNLALIPHRSLPDAYVTAHILRKQLALRPVDRLIQISSEPGFLYWCPGQKHKGKTFREVAQVDPSYLRWIADKSDMGEDEKFTARHWLQKAAA